MITKASIRQVVDRADQVFLRCWGTLLRLRGMSVERDEMLAFQPALAGALFEVDGICKEITHELKRLRTSKRSYHHRWLRSRFASLNRSKAIVKETAERGRNLGDLFAWFFYQREQHRIHEHLKREPIPQIPGTKGGLVEVDFASKHRIIGGRLFPLYHGITTFLRLGDFSFIDIETFALAGIGELKAGEVRDGQVTVFLTLVSTSPQLIELLGQAFGNISSDDKAMLEVRSPERFQRQIQSIVKSLALSPPASNIHVRATVSAAPFVGIAAEAYSQGVSFRRVSPSMAIMAVSLSSRRSLYARLAKGPTKNALAVLDRLNTEEFHYLATDRSEDNALWIGNLSYLFMPGVVPGFWRFMPLEMLDGMFHEALMVLTFYNPARLIQQLRTAGFEAEISTKEPTYIDVRKKLEKVHLKFQRNQYFLNLIQEHLVEDSCIVNFFVTCVSTLPKSVLTSGGVVEFVPIWPR